MQQGRHPPVDTLVDVSSIPEMRRLEIQPGPLQQTSAISSIEPVHRRGFAAQPGCWLPLVIEHAQALHEAASLIGGPQVRNTATLGGNVAHALPRQTA